MKGLYQDILLDHYQNPRNTGALADCDFTSGQYNPSCGDRVIVSGKISPEAILTGIQFQATGCVISVATASLLSEKIKGSSLAHLHGLETDDILALIGMQLGPTRLKCALLPLYALRDGLKSCRM